MRILAFIFVILPFPAMADLGHLTDVAGHGHWLGVAALGAAIAISIWAGSLDRDEEDEEADEEAQEA